MSLFQGKMSPEKRRRISEVVYAARAVDHFFRKHPDAIEKDHRHDGEGSPYSVLWRLKDACEQLNGRYSKR